MSIIQTIRDKGAKVAVVLIALALLGFIAMDALTGRSTLFGGGPSNTVGKVNGKSIDLKDFLMAREQQSNSLVQQGYPSGDATTERASDAAWNQSVSKILIEEEINKLGIRVTPKELSNSILFGANPPEDFKRNFTDPNTGIFNAQQAAQQVREIQRKGTAEQKANVNAYIDQQQFIRMYDKFNSMLVNSINFPKWMIEKQNADNAQIAKISYIKIPYSDIADSSIKITDQEIDAYVSKHKADFKQEESRSISYVAFSAAPNGADSIETRNQLMTIRPELDTTKNIEGFLMAQGVNNYYNGYISGKAIQIAVKDSLFKTPVGGVFGPYFDGPNYTLAKMVGMTSMPDTAKVRHILIATTQRDPQTGQMVGQIRDTATARHLIDSVQMLLASGQPFDSVCAHLSEDPGSKDKGGVYEMASGQMAPEFNDFAFTKPVGYKGVVYTEFGFHYMEVLSTKGSGMGYKIAYVTKPILAGKTTIDNALNDASQFASKSKTEKLFNETYDKEIKPRGINKGVANDIRPIGSEVQGLGSSREFVRKIYEADRGDVIEPQRVGENYVVAVVTGVFKEGTKPASLARMNVEPLLRNQKKAEMIKTQIGPITTLEAASTKMNKPVEVADSVRMSGGTPALGYESKLIGASFNPANRNKVVTEAIPGATGVFVLRVDNVSATAALEGNIADQRKAMYEQNKQQAQYRDPLQAIKAAASIKDYRAKHF